MMQKRGATRREVKDAILKGAWERAKLHRFEAKLSFPYQKKWNATFYDIKQINPVFIEEDNTIIVITVYAFYFNS